MMSLPSRTASAISCNTFGLGVEYTGTTSTAGYSCAFRGAPTTDAKTPPRLTLAISFSAVRPSTVSATASRGERLENALSSSVPITWSAAMVFASSICLLRMAAVTVAPRCLAVKAAERPTPPAAPETSTVCSAPILVPEIRSLPVVVTNGKPAASIKSRPGGTLAKLVALTTQSSAYAPDATANTFSPTEKPSTPEPTLRMVPETSTPINPGNLMG